MLCKILLYNALSESISLLNENEYREEKSFNMKNIIDYRNYRNE